MNGLRSFFYFLACMLAVHGWQMAGRAMPEAVLGTPVSAMAVSACHHAGHAAGVVHGDRYAGGSASVATAHGGILACQIACALAGAPALISPIVAFDQTVDPLRIAIIPILLLIEAAAPDHPPPIA